MRDAAANYSRILFRVANLAKWPAKHKPQSKISRFVKAQGYDETIALTDRLKEYVKKWEMVHPDTRAWLERKGYW